MEIHRDYPCNAKNCQRGRALPVSFLVVHYVGALGDAQANARYYHSTPGIGASAHYFVGHGPDAGIWSSVAEGDTAWHCGRMDGKYVHPQCRNANSIGVELCCHQDGAGTWYFDRETVDRAVELGRDIMARYGIPVDRVLRHYDVTGKLCPRPFVEDSKAWNAFKARLEERDLTEAEVRDIVQKAVNEALAERDAVAAQVAQKVSLWAKEPWDKLTGRGIFDGTRPGGPLTREQAAVVLDRLGLIE